MTEKRYYKKDWEESYYVFDSKTLSESEFEERVEYEGYDVFGDSLTGSEIIDLLNENDELKQVLGSILIEVKQQFSTHKTGEIRVFINPNSFNLISEVLRKYGTLKEWYE